MLLAHRVDVLRVADDGTTALHVAAAYGCIGSVQLLVLHGVSTALLHKRITAAEVASAYNRASVAKWLLGVAGWPQLRVAAATRQHKAASMLLRRGNFDPDASVETMMQALAAANAPPAVCKATQKLVTAATSGWHRTTHWLHHGAVRRTVFAVPLVENRLAHQQTLPLLPIEIWTYAMQFLKRSWWQNEQIKI